MLIIWLKFVFRKLGTSTSGTSCILHNSREPTTMGLYLNVVFHKIIVRCVRNCASCRIPGLFAVRNECSFYSVQERKSRQLKLKLNLSHTPRRRTSALDDGEWSASRPDRALAPEKGPPVPIVQEAGWAPEPVWTQRLQEKFFRLRRGSNFDRPVVPPVARHYTDWAKRLTKSGQSEKESAWLVVTSHRSMITTSPSRQLQISHRLSTLIGHNVSTFPNTYRLLKSIQLEAGYFRCISCIVRSPSSVLHQNRETEPGKQDGSPSWPSARLERFNRRPDAARTAVQHCTVQRILHGDRSVWSKAVVSHKNSL
jgi:hypothetical protein